MDPCSVQRVTVLYALVVTSKQESSRGPPVIYHTRFSAMTRHDGWLYPSHRDRNAVRDSCGLGLFEAQKNQNLLYDRVPRIPARLTRGSRSDKK